MLVFFLPSSTSGPNNATEWAIEGRRLVPLLPRLLPQTIYSGLADSAACSAAAFNARLPPPGDGGNKEGEKSLCMYVFGLSRRMEE